MKSIQRMLILAGIAFLPLLAQGQMNKPTTLKTKKMIITEQVYDKGKEVAVYKDMEVMYDVRGNVIEEIEYKDGKPVAHFQYRYDDADNKILEVELEGGKIKKTSEYKYNSLHQRTEKTVYDGSKNLKSKKTYQYDSY